MSAPRAQVPAPHDDERGLTLVELLVTMLISSFFLVLVVSLFVRTLDVQNSVLSTTSTSNDAKVAFDALESGVRRAVTTDVRLATAMSTEPGDGRGDVLIVKSRVNEGAVGSVATWRCMGWYLDGAKNLRAITGPAVATGTPKTHTAPSTWPVVARNVTKVGASAFLAQDADVATEQWYPGSVVAALEFTPVRSDIPVKLTSTVVPRRQLNGLTPGGLPCAQF